MAVTKENKRPIPFCWKTNHVLLISMTTCYHIIALLPYPYYDLIVFIIFYLLPFLCAFILCHSFISSPHNECRSSGPRPVKCPHNECRSSGPRPINFKVFIQNYVYKIKFKNLIWTSKLKFSFRGFKVVGLTNHRKSWRW